MMKRMCNVILFSLFLMSGSSISAEVERGHRPDTCVKPIDVCCPPVVPSGVRNIEKKICCVSNQINECCDRLENDINNCCDRLEIDITDCCNEIIHTITEGSTFDFLISATSLNTGATTNINIGGTYLLVGGNITITNPPPSGILIDITTGCVTFDLGGRCIDANSLVNVVFNVSNQDNVVIKNGTISNATQHAIFINNSTNVTLQDLLIENITGGDSILIQNSINVTLDNVTVSNNQQNGITFQNDIDVSLTNSSVLITSIAVTNQIGVNVVDTANVFIDNVKVINNFNGFEFNNSVDIVIDNSIAENNINYGYFYTGTSRNIIFTNDVAINNTVGGYYFNGIDIIMRGSTSVGNGTYGFFFDQNTMNVAMDTTISSFNQIGIFINQLAQFIDFYSSQFINNASIDIQNNSVTTNISDSRVIQNIIAGSVISVYDQTNFTTTGITINAPGVYIIDTDVTFNITGSFAITVNSSDVVVDLGGHIIDMNGVGLGGIVVNNFNNVTIQHGSIINTVGNAIQINNCSGTIINNMTIDNVTTINTSSVVVNNSTSTVIQNTHVNNNSGGSCYFITNSSETTVQNSSGCASSNSGGGFPFGVITSLISDATSVLDSVLCSKPTFSIPAIGIAASGGVGLIANNVQMIHNAAAISAIGVVGAVISNIAGIGLGAGGGIIVGAGCTNFVIINSIINGSGGVAFYANAVNTIFNNCIAINNIVAGFSFDVGAIDAIIKLCTSMGNGIGLAIAATAENIQVIDTTINNNTSIDIQDNSTSSNITNVNINTVQHIFSSNVVTTFNQTNFNVTGLTIDVPGTYIIEQDIAFTTGGFAITISSDDVTVDLGGQTIDCNGTGSGIVINNFNNVNIQHGSIINTVGNAIQINNCSGTVINNITTDNVTTINTSSIAVNNSTSTIINNTNVNNNSGGSCYSITNSSETTVRNSSGCGSSSSGGGFPFGIISSLASDATSVLDSVLCSKPTFPIPSIGIAASGGVGLIANNVQMIHTAAAISAIGVAGAAISNITGIGLGAGGGIIVGAGCTNFVVINSIINGSGGVAFFADAVNTIFNNCTAINNIVAGFSFDVGAIDAIVKLCTSMGNGIGLAIAAAAENIQVIDTTINDNTIDIEDNSTSTNITNVNINTVQHIFSSNVVTTFNQTNFNVGGQTINVSGTYIVEQDIMFTTGGFAVTINADDVTFDLGGQTINCNGTGTGIVVNNTNNVTIRNGFITNTGGNAIQVNNATNTAINNMNVSNMMAITTPSVAVNGSSFTTINNTFVTNETGGPCYTVNNSNNTTTQDSGGCGGNGGGGGGGFPLGLFQAIASTATSVIGSAFCQLPGALDSLIGLAGQGGEGLLAQANRFTGTAGGIVTDGMDNVQLLGNLLDKMGPIGGILMQAGSDFLADSNIMTQLAGPGMKITAATAALSQANKIFGPLADAFTSSGVTGLIHNGDQAIGALGAGFNISNVTNGLLQGCKAINSGTQGISMVSSDGMLIDGCDVAGAALAGIDITSLTNSAVKGCSVAKTGGAGISMVTSDGMLIDGCDISDTALAGINITGSTNSPIKLTSIAKTGAQGIALQTCDAMLIDGCDVTDTALAAISIISSTNTPVKLCSVAKTGAEGIALQTCDAMLIDSCDITDTALAAISIISSTNSGVSDLNITSPFTGALVDLSDNINLTGCDVWNPQTDGIMFMNTQNSSAKLCSVGKAGGKRHSIADMCAVDTRWMYCSRSNISWNQHYRQLKYSGT